MFIDEVVLDVIAGDGGSGMTAFRREKFVPKGGPSGGDGGNGGSVYLVADPQLWTLLDYTYQRRWVARSGEPGGPRQQTGRTAEDLVLPVPPGTEVRDAKSGDLIGEVLGPGERLLLARGGKGGLGNQHFATPTRQAPHHYQPGKEGERRRIGLTLKLIADAGLLGEPNAGKSTLLASVTAARPKIADYPFTTLYPQPGVVSCGLGRSFVMMDIPGLIEGAAEGAGLGHRFLKHLQRTRLLLHLVDVNPPGGEDIVQQIKTIRAELKGFSAELAGRTQWLVFNKSDTLPADELAALVKNTLKKLRHKGPHFVISAVTRAGVPELCEQAMQWVEQQRPAVQAGSDDAA